VDIVEEGFGVIVVSEAAFCEIVDDVLFVHLGR